MTDIVAPVLQAEGNGSSPADHPATGNGARPQPRPQRRLSDKVLAIFHQACDQEDFEVAEHLLRVCEVMLARPTSGTGRDRRHNLDTLVAAHERLWHLRHPEQP